MKKLTLTCMALLLAAMATAQVGDDWDKKTKESNGNAFDEYEKFKQQSFQQYDDFRRQANEEYAKFMEEAWNMYSAKDAEEIQWRPKPTEPLEEEDITVTNSEIFYEDEINSANAILEGIANVNTLEQPEPMQPIVPVFDANATVMSIFLYGSAFPIRYEPEKESRFKLNNISEKSVARFWKKLSCRYYDNIVAECLQQRKESNLCDWAYVKLTENMAEKYFGEDTNESVVLQMYLLTQSGYQVRMARAENKLTLLIGSKEKIYRYKYFVIKGLRFYILDKSLKNKSMNVYDRAFPKEQTLSLAMKQPKFSVTKTQKRTIASKKYPEMTVSIELNQNLLDFYNECPLSSQWNYYSMASFSDLLKSEIYPTFREALKGKTELEAANMLLDFVQTGFSYRTDQEQFGYERPLYPDETFYYPYCDCEDRSILFSCLVRELLGLDVVLLNYPEHLATAVRFNEDVKGDFLMVDGQKYIICEPTFISSVPVGRCAKQFKDVTPKVVKI